MKLINDINTMEIIGRKNILNLMYFNFSLNYQSVTPILPAQIWVIVFEETKKVESWSDCIPLEVEVFSEAVSTSLEYGLLFIVQWK